MRRETGKAGAGKSKGIPSVRDQIVQLLNDISNCIYKVRGQGSEVRGQGKKNREIVKREEQLQVCPFRPPPQEYRIQKTGFRRRPKDHSAHPHRNTEYRIQEPEDRSQKKT